MLRRSGPHQPAHERPVEGSQRESRNCRLTRLVLVHLLFVFSGNKTKLNPAAEVDRDPIRICPAMRSAEVGHLSNHLQCSQYRQLISSFRGILARLLMDLVEPILLFNSIVLSLTIGLSPANTLGRQSQYYALRIVYMQHRAKLRLA